MLYPLSYGALPSGSRPVSSREAGALGRADHTGSRICNKARPGLRRALGATQVGSAATSRRGRGALRFKLAAVSFPETIHP